MDIKQLEYFIKICDCGSFTQAAHGNYISPQGINSAILRLEKELGTSLLHRSNTGVYPTVDGEYLYRMAFQIVTLFQECKTYFQMESKARASLTISLNTDVLAVLPEAACRLIINKYDMEILSGGGYSCETNLLNYKSTFALVDGPPFNPKLTYQHCLKREYLLIANKLHALAAHRNLRMRDLEGQKFVSANATYKMYGNFVDLCATHRFSPNIEIFANSATETYNLLHNRTDLIGITCDAYISNNTDPNIVALPVNDLCWSFDIYLAYRKKADLTGLEQSFLSDFLSSFSGEIIF